MSATTVGVGGLGGGADRMVDAGPRCCHEVPFAGGGGVVGGGCGKTRMGQVGKLLVGQLAPVDAILVGWRRVDRSF
jgi:hypothetical protein